MFLFLLEYFYTLFTEKIYDHLNVVMKIYLKNHEPASITEFQNVQNGR